MPAASRPQRVRFMHMWRVAVDMIVEHWVCRDDMGGSSSCAIDRRAPGVGRPFAGAFTRA